MNEPLTSHGLQTKGVFHGLEEIPDESSALVKNENRLTTSNGRWSSDMHDETSANLALTHRNEPQTMMLPATSAFNDQSRKPTTTNNH